MSVTYVRTDGGRADAGYKGEPGDCVCRAFVIASGQPYAKVYALINDLAKRERRKGRRSSARNGVFTATIRKLAIELGARWVPTMFIGSGCKVHIRKDELPAGRLVLSLSGHCAAFIDGVLHDTSDCSRGGTRCVYGYWIFP